MRAARGEGGKADDPLAGRSRRSPETVRASLLAAARQCLLEHGSAGLSTRRLAEAAGVPLSQIHYHFRSKQGVLLALLEQLQRRSLPLGAALRRQSTPLSRRWRLACVELDDATTTGELRLLLALTDAAMEYPEVAGQARRLVRRVFDDVEALAAEVTGLLGGGAFSPSHIAALAVQSFLGAGSLARLGVAETDVPVRAAMTAVGMALERLERRAAARDRPGGTATQAMR